MIIYQLLQKPFIVNQFCAAALNIGKYYLLNSYDHILKLEVVVPDSLSVR